ncbi:Putative deoxyribonuclease RhsC [Vibrio aerogenes CECT 7868]|uniref:Putative deoxyribonuclease RhsC n=1 Tax=Vibrio aerogenes CECT 7868 TaxID=1216006 RepID=A0A1M5XEW4_9VIBR|nr:RHS repeat-associated core domain-containing protein [Vibrio aerogenes]SHH98360.1 Putative deoxyribonuclease RhsC [Vibrio aerogenes CECT 7868]
MNDAVHCDLRYQGQLEDTESGLYYNLNRYFDSDSGQYLSPDPIGFAGGLRPQGYVHNPVAWVDPLGLSPDCGDANFADESKLTNHYEKHGAEFGAESEDEYLSMARQVMNEGTPVQYEYKGELRTGFVQLMGNNRKGQAKFAFVGTNSQGQITTLHTKSGKDFWKTLNGSASDKPIRPANL